MLYYKDYDIFMHSCLLYIKKIQQSWLNYKLIDLRINKEDFGNLFHRIDTLRKEIKILELKVYQGVIRLLF